MGSATILDVRAFPETNDGAQSMGFLRRFADVMAGGGNASKLLQAADVIEDLVNRAGLLVIAASRARQSVQVRGV
jgi:hypothetical protein